MFSGINLDIKTLFIKAKTDDVNVKEWPNQTKPNMAWPILT